MEKVKKLSNYIDIKKDNDVDNKYHFSIGCLICNEPVPLTEEEESRMLYGLHIHSKICDKCKQAVLHVRTYMEDINKEGNDYDKNV